MAPAVQHVVVFVQENHTTDNYFWSMRAWGREHRHRLAGAT